MGELIPLYKEMVETGNNFHGLSILPHTGIIRKMINKTDAKTLLDYGSGRGDQYEPPNTLHAVWGVPKPFIYDPAFSTHDVLPVGTFDGVLCSDVLEHVPEQELDELIITLFNYAEKFVWASVCCRPAKKCFPDGRNMHVTINSIRWWRDLINKYANGKYHHITETF